MATFISLNQYDLVEVAGVDAEKYLQGQLTCDVVHLAAGASTLTAHCDPKGKMNSLFRLIKLSSEQFLILMPKNLFTPLEHLKKYAVFSKVTFQVLDLANCWLDWLKSAVEFKHKLPWILMIIAQF